MNITQILTIAIPAIFAFLSGFYLYRIKYSIIRLQKKFDIQRIASSYEDNFWGNIHILHNDRLINHLHFVRIDIFNNSKKDVDDLTIKLALGETNSVLSSFALNTDTQLYLSESEAFKEQMSLNNLEYLQKNREYSSKVINRRTQITINLLLESQLDSISEQDIVVAIEKKGIKLVPYKKITSDTIGLWSMFIGFIVSILAGYLTYLNFPESQVPIFIVTLIGSLNVIIGIIIFYSIAGWKHASDDN